LVYQEEEQDDTKYDELVLVGNSKLLSFSLSLSLSLSLFSFSLRAVLAAFPPNQEKNCTARLFFVLYFSPYSPFFLNLSSHLPILSRLRHIYLLLWPISSSPSCAARFLSFTLFLFSSYHHSYNTHTTHTHFKK